MKNGSRLFALAVVVSMLLAACSTEEERTLSTMKSPKSPIAVNVLLNVDATPAAVRQLEKFGRVNEVLHQIDAVTMMVRGEDLEALRALPIVAAANPDAERHAGPIDTVAVDNFVDGLSTWNLDVVNVTNPKVCDIDNDGIPDVFCGGRVEEHTGEGVYVAVLDTGLLDTWRQYFPEERIAAQYAKSFGGGGNERGKVSEQPNKWEHDVNGHGTHVTSTIIGYDLGGVAINGVAPMATVIPVKVLNQNGSGWSSVVARGIEYIGDLKAGPLQDSPVVINMSLGGPVLDPVEKAAIDYAIDQGVIIVASAGNQGELGMGYPGAYEPVISVAASGWAGEWLSGNWYIALDDPDPNDTSLYYITDFSSRELQGQQLDVAAPGSWIVGPYQLNRGQTSYFFLGGTSMASPHVAGVVALMSQKNGALTAADAEDILKSTALTLDPGCLEVHDPSGATSEVCWDANATGAGIVTADAALGAMP